MNSLSFNLIPFVSPSEENPKESFSSKTSCNTSLSGAEVSNFYNCVISLPSEQQSSNNSSLSLNPKRRKNTKPLTRSSISNIKFNSIFLYAQQGNVRQIQQCIENGCPINQQDAYGWTPIMCATCEGHYNVVECLIKAGADLNLQCKFGMTVMDIAVKTKNSSLVKLLQEGIIDETEPLSLSTVNGTEDREKFCNICKITYKMSTIAHERSIPHLLKSKKSSGSTFYHIPENNKGFQIMLKSGWDKNKGLGMNADGRKFPIKTVLKTDRSCIGKNKEVPKVTHFNANDTNSVKALKHIPVKVVREKTLKKWARKKHDIIHRQKEIDFRRQFNSEF